MRWFILLMALLCSLGVQAASYSLLVEWRADQTSAQRQAQQQAMLLFIDMVPAGSRASIWLYADRTQNLVADASVGPAWRAQARSAVASNPNLGTGSQLGLALDQISRQTASGQSHFLLLTDGQLRGIGDTAATVRERNRILQQQLPLLRQRGVQVHSISLAPADEQLLQFLSFRTNGQFQSLQSAEQLPRALARALQLSMASHELPVLPVIARAEPAGRPASSAVASPVARPSPQVMPSPQAISGSQAVAPQSLPSLSESTGQHFSFITDAQAQQLLLWFEHSEPQALSLLTPEQERIDWNTQRPDVQWRTIGSWQLLVLQQPLVGEWQLTHSMASQPMVELVTNLQLSVTGLNSVYSPGQAVRLGLSLQPAINQPVSYQVQALHQATGQQLDFSLAGNQAELPALPMAGEWLISARAHLPGIERLRSWPVLQQSPLALELQPLPQGLQLQLQALGSDLDPAASRVSMEVRGPNTQFESAMTPMMDGFAAFIAPQEPGLYQARFSGVLQLGSQSVNWQSGWYQWQWPMTQALLQPNMAEEAAQVASLPMVSPVPSPLASLEVLTVPAPERVASSGRYWLYALAVLPGLLFLALVFWIYKRIERKLAANAPLVDEQIQQESKEQSLQMAAGLGGIDLSTDDGALGDKYDSGMALNDLPDLDEQLQEEPVAGISLEQDAASQTTVDNILDDDLISLSETVPSSNRQSDLQQVDELQKSLDELASQYEDEALTGLDVGDEELDLDSLDAAWFESGQELPEADLPPDGSEDKKT